MGELVPGIGSGLICHGAVLKAAGLAISVGFFFLLLYKVTAPCKGGHCLELNAFVGFFLKGNTNDGSRGAFESPQLTAEGSAEKAKKVLMTGRRGSTPPFPGWGSGHTF